MKRIIIIVACLIPAIAEAERAPKAPSSALTVDGILDKINSSYMPGLRRCYTKGLASDPTLAGKAVATFTVNRFGNVSGTVAGIEQKVDSCLTQQLSRWKFANPRTDASFKISLALLK